MATLWIWADPSARGLKRREEEAILTSFSEKCV